VTRADRLPLGILWGVLVLVLASVGAAFVASRFGPAARARKLPVLGAVPEFSLSERGGSKVTRADLLGRVSVVDFIFTSCSAQCPLVTAQMLRIQERLIPRHPDLRLVSITVDPERDTPEELAEFAAAYGADPERWWFLTGSREALDDLIRKGFKVPNASLIPVDTSPDAVLHSVSLVLVDPQARIRGYYQATDADEMRDLRSDLSALATAPRRTAAVLWHPTLNASLNALSFVLLAAGFAFIRGRQVALHRASMLAACGASLLFLISYLAYHARVGSVRFTARSTSPS
jgi:cytochrome oxidase Cu insertion factor (SCO1/SenC/PrrC family)